jgi:hypothetical protein
MLVDLTIKMWSGRTVDRKASEEVANLHNSDATMGRYWKNLVETKHLEPLRKAQVRAMSDHRDMTLPWQDSGARILMGAGYANYRAKMNQHQQTIYDLTQVFLNGYDVARAEAKLKLNGLFREDDYPPTHVLARKFGFSVDVLPFPSAADFRVDLSDDVTEVIRRSIETSTREAVEQAMQEAWQRVYDVTQKMSERLHAYTVLPDGKTLGVFRDSLVENVRDLVNLLPSLNLTEDARLTQVTEAMAAKLTTYDPQVLRDSAQARQTTADAADEILGMLGEFGIS